MSIHTANLASTTNYEASIDQALLPKHHKHPTDIVLQSVDMAPSNALYQWLPRCAASENRIFIIKGQPLVVLGGKKLELQHNEAFLFVDFTQDGVLLRNHAKQDLEVMKGYFWELDVVRGIEKIQQAVRQKQNSNAVPTTNGAANVSTSRAFEKGKVPPSHTTQFPFTEASDSMPQSHSSSPDHLSSQTTRSIKPDFLGLLKTLSNAPMSQVDRSDSSSLALSIGIERNQAEYLASQAYDGHSSYLSGGQARTKIMALFADAGWRDRLERRLNKPTILTTAASHDHTEAQTAALGNSAYLPTHSPFQLVYSGISRTQDTTETANNLASGAAAGYSTRTNFGSSLRSTFGSFRSTFASSFRSMRLMKPGSGSGPLNDIYSRGNWAVGVKQTNANLGALPNSRKRTSNDLEIQQQSTSSIQDNAQQQIVPVVGPDGSAAVANARLDGPLLYDSSMRRHNAANQCVSEQASSQRTNIDSGPERLHTKRIKTNDASDVLGASLTLNERQSRTKPSSLTPNKAMRSTTRSHHPYRASPVAETRRAARDSSFVKQQPHYSDMISKTQTAYTQEVIGRSAKKMAMNALYRSDNVALSNESVFSSNGTFPSAPAAPATIETAPSARDSDLMRRTESTADQAQRKPVGAKQIAHIIKLRKTVGPPWPNATPQHFPNSGTASQQSRAGSLSMPHSLQPSTDTRVAVEAASSAHIMTSSASESPAVPNTRQPLHVKGAPWSWQTNSTYKPYRQGETCDHFASMVCQWNEDLPHT